MIRSNVAIRTRAPELIDFFYPNYTRLSEYSPFVDGGVIFEGDSKYLQSFRDANIPYIYVKGTPEYDLTIPLNLLEFVYDKWDKKPPKGLTDYFSGFDKMTDELEEIAKQVWVTGKCTLDDNAVERMNNLYSLMARGATYDIIKEFISLSDRINQESLFYSIQRFIKSSNNPESVKSINTRRNLTTFISTRSNNIRPALMDYLYSPADNVELKLLKLFDTLTSSTNIR